MAQTRFVSFTNAAAPRLQMTNVVAVNNAEKQAMLRAPAKLIEEQTEPTRRILTNLERLSPEIAGCLSVKSPINADVPFRLVRKDVTASKPFKSFVALSYRWLQDDSVIPEAPWPTRLPIDPDMFQAVLEELEEGEGLWCDQISIDQRDEADKARVIESMDTIYRAARLIVVVLGDDAILSAEEGRFLVEDLIPLSQRCPNFTIKSTAADDIWVAHLRGNPMFAQCVFRLLNSSLFERAWCSHELRIARQAVFLARCHMPDEHGEFQIVRIPSKILFHMIAVCMINDRVVLNMRELDPRLLDLLKRIGKKVLGILFRAEQPGAVISWPTSSETLGSWKNRYRNLLLRTHADEIFSLQAGGNPMFAESRRRRRIDAFMDLICIVLNVSEYAISCSRSALVDRLMTAVDGVEDGAVDDALHRACMEVIITFALAAGDPNALCMRGRPLETSRKETSWMCLPEISEGKTNIDFQRYRAMPDDSVTSLGDDNRYIVLPLWRLSALTEQLDIGQESTYRRVALIFTQECYDKDVNNSERFQVHKYLSFHPPDHEDHDDALRYRELFEKVVACCLYCGMDWVLGLARKVRNIGREVEGTLQRLFWCVKHIDTHGYQAERYHSLLDSAAKVWSAYRFMRLVESVLQLGYRDSSGSREPLLLRFKGGKRILTFAHKTASGGSRHELVIPAGLTDESHWQFPRMWALEPRERDDPGYQHKAFVAVRKTFAFGDLPDGKGADMRLGQVTWAVYGK